MKRKLLVVDDDKSIIQLLRFVLEKEYDVILADNPVNALALLKTLPIDGVVSDISMPEMDGYEFLQAIRNEFQSPIPVIMLSSKDSSNDKIKFLDAGADDYLVKPFNPQELIARLKTIYRRVSAFS